ncbi:hypothetical protein QUB68_07660 [Microcoleus sp. A006_D1]
MSYKSGIENDNYNSSLQQFLPIVQISIYLPSTGYSKAFNR